METEKTTPKTIDEYIAKFDPEVQEKLNAVRKVIKAAAPAASEKISWDMPTFYQYGNLVHFAAHKKHIGFYPAPAAIERFKEKIAEYHAAKGTLQFPYNKPIPFDLISEIVRFRVLENTLKFEDKKKSPKQS